MACEDPAAGLFMCRMPPDQSADASSESNLSAGTDVILKSKIPILYPPSESSAHRFDRLAKCRWRHVANGEQTHIHRFPPPRPRAGVSLAKEQIMLFGLEARAALLDRIVNHFVLTPPIDNQAVTVFSGR